MPREPENHRPGADSPRDLEALAQSARDPSAFAALHDRLAPGLERHFARRLAERGLPGGDAQELAQRAWIIFHDSLTKGQYDPAKSRLSTFLYAVANVVWMRAAREAGRASANRERLAQETRARTEVAENPSDLAAHAALLDLVRSSLRPGSDFSDIEAQALRAIAEGRTDRDLAREMRVSPSTAHERKQSALGKLRTFLAGRGFGEAAGRAREERKAKKP